MIINPKPIAFALTIVLSNLTFFALARNGYAGDLAKPELGFRAPEKQPTTNEPFPAHDNNVEKKADGDFETSDSSNLILRAKLIKDGPDINDGLIWRIYSPLIGLDNKLPLIATASGGSAHFTLHPGTYFVNVAFGHANLTRRVNIQKNHPVSDAMILDAGGLQMNATMPKGKINEKRLTFEIYKDDDENEQQSLVLAGVKPNMVVRLNAGMYHIVSKYGSANAVMRTDVKVDSGKITQVNLLQHAAQITLKLVRQAGGEALADTSWSIANDSGDIIGEMAGAYASLVLAEGDYVAVAKNKDVLYQKEFSVETGKDQDIEVPAEPQATNEDADAPMD